MSPHCYPITQFVNSRNILNWDYFDRLLYYPPLIIDDDKNENFTKGSATYSHQKTNFDESQLGKLEIKDDEEDATVQHVLKDDINKNITRCGAHCVCIISVL